MLCRFCSYEAFVCILGVRVLFVKSHSVSVRVAIIYTLSAALHHNKQVSRLYLLFNFADNETANSFILFSKNTHAHLLLVKNGKIVSFFNTIVRTRGFGKMVIMICMYTCDLGNGSWAFANLHNLTPKTRMTSYNDF